MARGDFNYIPVNHTFDENSPDWVKDFHVELSSGQAVVDDGYILITVRSVDAATHEIRINNVGLSGWDIPLPPGNSDTWLTYMDRIQPNVLKPNEDNKIEIQRVGDDDFLVKDLVVHWREK